MQKIFITGACGFLGSNVAKHFHSLGSQIFGIDHKPSCSEVFSKFHTMDLADPALPSEISKFAPDLVFHAAGRASPAKSMTHPAEDFEGNVRATQVLLEAVRLSGLRPRMIFCSSAAVYGQPNCLPVTEEAPVAPLSPYGFHKKLAESLFLEYERVYSIPFTVLRIFSVYGAGLRRQVVFDWIHRATTEGRLHVHGTGRETRDFIHIRDFCCAVEAVACSNQGPSIVNVASGEESSLHQLSSLVAEYCCLSTEPVFNQLNQPGMPDRWLADISRLHAMGFRPSISFSEGVAETVDWYRTMGTR